MKIIIYCGDSWEAWSPKSVEKGLGGSEEAVINIAFELARLGHEVTVYNRCEDMADEYFAESYPGGELFVTYKDYLDYEGEECEVFIGWRTLNPWKVAKNFKVGYHWLHDTSPEEDVLTALSLGAHKVMVLSQYHRRLYPNLLNREIFLTRNGINNDLFLYPSGKDRHLYPEGKVELKPRTPRVPYRIFYGSSYDRGLKDLLEIWPEVKLQNPEAELRVAYGWETIDRMIESGGHDHLPKFKEHMVELMNQEGVTHLGRISHGQVAEEFLSADVWAYPTWWPEISCITAMKAQAGGAIPVVIPTAAVAETTQFGSKTDRGFYHSLTGSIVMPAEAMDQFKYNLLTILSRPMEEKEEYRNEMMSWARSHYSWKGVAEDWTKEFTKALDEKGN